MDKTNKTSTFLTELFAHTEKDIWLQAIGDKPGLSSGGRSHTGLTGFLDRYDVPGNGVYCCVSTTSGAERKKQSLAEITCMQLDIDSKDILGTATDVDRALQRPRLLPSIINNSGNGRHAYWLFKEPLPATEGNQARVEAALKQLADLFAGDMAVTHCAALMRLPGTHNSKHGAWVECQTIYPPPLEISTAPGSLNKVHPVARYEIDDLEEWLAETSPLILRRDRPNQYHETNPFLAIAAKLGFKPPVDVEKRLGKMLYMGVGEASIHETQVSVSASLLKRGKAVDEVVTLLLDATRAAAGDYGKHWNWRREERAIEKMCTDWERKHPASGSDRSVIGIPMATNPPQAELSVSSPGAPASNIIALAPVRAQRSASGGTSHHVILGSAVLGAIRARGDDMLVSDGEIWFYHDGLWSQPKHERHWLDVELEAGAVGLELPSTIKLINEARTWLLRRPELARADVAWDSHGKVPTRSGLLDIATLELEPARPEHLATWRIECLYDPDAGCPWWLLMLEHFFADRDEALRAATIGTLQEVLGAALVEDKPRELTRALVLEGPSEAGKTRILDVMAGLFGNNPIATPLDGLSGTHGLMEFRRRAPWVLHEAFNAGIWHLSSVVKSILTGDPVQINIKNGALVTQRIKSPVFWATNHPPQFREATKAIVNRMIVVKCRTIFDPKRLIGTAAEAARLKLSGPSKLVLKHEMPGLLNWALVGLRRALERGHIELTEEMVETLVSVRQDSNIVAGFLDECCDYSIDGMISTADFCAAFTVWWAENKGEDRRSPSNENIGRAMAALGDKRIACDRSMRDMVRRYYGGIHLNTIGLDYWQGAHSEGLAKGKTARTSADRLSVNRVVPDAWRVRPALMTATREAMTASRPAMTVSNANEEAEPENHDRPPVF